MRVLSMQDGTWSLGEFEQPEPVQKQIQKDTLTWVRAGGFTPQRLEQVGLAFGLHPLAIEDVQHVRQRPKVEDYPGITFVVLRVPRFTDELGWQQVGLFLGKDYLITASIEPVPELDALQRRLLESGLPGPQSVGSLLHQAVDILIDAWFPYMDDLEDRIDALEDAASQGPTQEVLADIRAMKTDVSRTRKVTAPMREAMLSLERSEHPNILPETRLYLRDVSDHMVRLAERLEHVKEMVLIAQETWNATLANQQNQVMKRLTVVAALLLIPSLLAGIGGMNFDGLPDWQFWNVTTAIVAFVALGLGVSAWRGWL